MEDDYFFVAAEYARGLRNLNETSMLRLYGLYKQATVGPCNKSKPGFWDLVGKSKWESWKKLGNIDIDTAKREYIKLVEELDPEFDVQMESLREEEPSKGTKQNGMGLSVSTMSYEEDQYISDEDKTIFDWCKEGNVDKVSRTLKNKKVNIDIKDENGMTILHWSCDRGYTKLVNFLIKNKANVNAQDDELQTPLHYAAVCEHVDVIASLLAEGADPHLKDDTGTTPIEAATTQRIKDLLKQTSNFS